MLQRTILTTALAVAFTSQLAKADDVKKFLPGVQKSPAVQKFVLPPQQPQMQPKMLLPGDRPIPRLGFMGYAMPGYGMYVQQVFPGSTAARIGLEPGDIILSIDNVRIRHHNDYQFALSRAWGRTEMRVRDVRGRGIVRTSFYLPGGWGPQPVPLAGQVYSN